MNPREFDEAHFAVLEQVGHPAWVFDLEQERTFWSNQAGLDLFGAESLASLRERQARSVLSDGMRRRLAGYSARFALGEAVEERWTFYPEGLPPFEARCRCSALLLRQRGEVRPGMLVEAHPLGPGAMAQDVRLLEALHHVNDCISLYQLEGPGLARNEAATETLGPVAEADFSRSFMYPEHAAEAADRARTHGVYRDELPVRTVLGTLWFDTEVRQVDDPVDGGPALLVVQHDVTERRQTRARLVEALEQAEEASRAKSSFLAVMSHELRTPMMGVLTAAEILRQSELEDDQREALDMVFVAGRQMVQLIDDVLDLSRIEADEVVVHLGPTDVRRLLRETLRPFQGQAASRALTLSLEVDTSVPPRVRSDPRRLAQIVSNLVANALKFTERGGIEVQLAADSERDGSVELVLIVCDTGIGMSEEAASRVFDLFEQADPSAARSRDGAGLGLAIVRRLVLALGGEVSLRSRLGEGTTFSIRLPCEVMTEASPAPRNTPALVLPGLRVLVADDNALNRRALSRVLRRWGCEVAEASDGQEALDLAEETRPELILMDVWMPGMDGPSAARVLRAGPLSDTPLIALSADVFFENGEALFDRVLAKPIDWDVLQQALLERVNAR